MRHVPAALVLGLVLHVFASAREYSGTVVLPDGSPRQGVAVRVAGQTDSVLTDASGAWSLAALPVGVLARSVVGEASVARGRIDGLETPAWSGRDAAGRGARRGTPPAEGARAAAPRAAEALDTLVFSWMGRPFQRDTFSTSTSGIVRTFDTTWNGAKLYGRLVDSRDGKVYRTLRMGGVAWMAQNLDFRGEGADSGRTATGRPDSAWFYGRLYTWASAMDLPDTCDLASCKNQIAGRRRGLCPANWHVPSDSEWMDLERSIGMDSASVVATGVRGRQADALRSRFGWRSYLQLAGSDRTGFRVLGSGLVGLGAFPYGGYGVDAFFWTSTESGATNVIHRRLDNSVGILREPFYKPEGMALRCVQDP